MLLARYNHATSVASEVAAASLLEIFRPQSESRMIKTGNRTRYRASFSVLVLFFTAACARDAVAPTAPTPTSIVPIAIVPVEIVGKATGRLAGEIPPTRFGNPQAHVVSNATVTVVGGPASGTQAVTRVDGAYEVTAAGTFKLRFEHSLFIGTESSEIVMPVGGVTIPTVVLRTAPWTVFGRVIDSLGNPVPDAVVTLFRDREYIVALDGAVGRTDGAGRYSINSTQPHFELAFIGASKSGVGTGVVEGPCCGAAPDLRLRR
ncbi:MAG: carboxypeptidase-like regulatory domain-containing protein [Cyanobacteria bacterium]|nr:carboxypeptidase-like regulatory domain-containing protein [Cyanobacteriota bacterium]